jgi:hypothetical protein
LPVLARFLTAAQQEASPRVGPAVSPQEESAGPFTELAPEPVLVMQRVEDYQPPVWPGTSIVHLDLHGGTQIDQLERRALALGAQPHRRSRNRDGECSSILRAIRFCITPFTL